MRRTTFHILRVDQGRVGTRPIMIRIGRVDGKVTGGARVRMTTMGLAVADRNRDSSLDLMAVARVSRLRESSLPEPRLGRIVLPALEAEISQRGIPTL